MKKNQVQKIVWAVEWIDEKISKPLQVLIYVFFGLIFLSSLPLMIKGCVQRNQYETVNAFFIREEAPLHGDQYKVKVLDAIMVENIKVKENQNSDEPAEQQGNFVAITLCITQLNHDGKSHTLDKNDFKLKDHTGTTIPLSNILDMIDVNAPDLIFNQGDSVNSNSNFETITAVKDYTWIGQSIRENEENIITVYFKVDEKMDVKITIMILEVDFYVGVGEHSSATDIVLFEREKPIKK
jgi:hypothetical protein